MSVSWNAGLTGVSFSRILHIRSSVEGLQCSYVCVSAAEHQDDDNEARRRLARHRPVTLHHGQSVRRTPPSPASPGSPGPSAAGVDDVEMQNYSPGDRAAHEVRASLYI